MLSDANLISTLVVDSPNLAWFHQGSLHCICLLSETRKSFFWGGTMVIAMNSESLGRIR